MKDKAKSKLWNIVCAALTVAAGILYSVSVSGNVNETVYPLKGSNDAVRITETDAGNGQNGSIGSIEEADHLRKDTKPPAKPFLKGEELFDRTETAELININSADADSLMSIPGIGPSKADAILLYREENGPFACIEDIMLVPGIKAGTFEKIKSYIEAGS